MSSYFPSKKSIDIYLSFCTCWWIIAFIFVITHQPVEIFRPLNIHISDSVDTMMMWWTQMGEGTFIAIMGILVIVLRKDFRRLPVILLITLMLTLPSLVTNIVKSLADAPRPLALFGETDWIHWVEGYKNNFHRSWPSGHATGAFSVFFVLTYSLKDTFRWWAVLFFFCALVTGFSRIQLSQHFFEDVLAGSIIGTAVPYFLAYGFQFVKWGKSQQHKIN